MVVISASIVTKTNVLIARQFREVTRLRIEALLSAFLRLIDSSQKDHTYVETDFVRYVYLPIESLYLVLITNIDSNILEDLETLKVLRQIMQYVCEYAVNEDNVLTKAFDIVFAFDEAISFGYRESVSLNQIKTYTAMESHDEKLLMLVLKEKMREERKRGQAIAWRLEKERKERMKSEQAQMKQVNALTNPISVIEVTPSPVELNAIQAPSIPMPTFAAKGMDLKKKKTTTLLLLESLEDED